MPAENSDKLKTFNKGQVIFKEGQPVPMAFMVKKGSVTVYRVTNNRRVVTARHKPGAIFGELALLTGDPFHATAEADDYTELMVMDKDLLQSMIVKCPNPVQRILKNFMVRLKAADCEAKAQPSSNTFFGVCQVLELMHRVSACEGNGGAKGISHVDFSRTVKNILLLSQLEVDTVIKRLAALNVIDVSDLKEASYKKDVLGRVEKSRELTKDRFLTIKDPSKFLSVAWNLSQEEENRYPHTEGLEFMDIQEFAKIAKAKPEMIYKKIGNNEVPENFFFLSRQAVTEWMEEVGSDYFQKTKRKKVDLKDLENVDDMVYVDNGTLQQAYSELGFHKLAILFASAGDEARQKMLSILSKKIAAVVQEEAADRVIDEIELGDIEDELYGIVRKIKGAGK